MEEQKFLKLLVVSILGKMMLVAKNYAEVYELEALEQRVMGPD